MKATGIVRRIDDLGRVVIPKEIRRTMRIREGDPLEIYTGKEGEIILKKYSPMGEFGGALDDICEAVYKSSKRNCVICDRDWVVAAAGPCKPMVVEKTLSEEMKEVMEYRKKYRIQKGESGVLLTTEAYYEASLVYPILAEGDLAGAILYLDQEKDVETSDGDDLLLHAIALFLGGYMES